MSKLVLLILLLSNVKTIEESGTLKFKALNTTYLEVKWSQLISSDMMDVKEAILYQAKPEGYSRIGSAHEIQAENTSILVKHNPCLRLNNVFLQITTKDSDIYSSRESSYSPPNYLEVIFIKI